MDPGSSSTIDLRYIILFLLNLFLTSAEKYSVLNMDEEHLVLNLVFLFVAMFFVLLFLFTPIEFPVCGGPITIRFGFYSVPLAILLLFSVTLTPFLFWLACILVIPTTAWHGKFWGLFKRLFRGFSRTLRRIPPIFIRIYCQQNLDTADAAGVSEFEVDEREGSLMQSQQEAEQYSITIGDSFPVAAAGVTGVEFGEMEGSQMQIQLEEEQYAITVGDSRN
ncbi:hypothetical protein PTKIN_Ptkin04bG0219300 [Pterospermum kingtungense]